MPICSNHFLTLVLLHTLDHFLSFFFFLSNLLSDSHGLISFDKGYQVRLLIRLCYQVRKHKAGSPRCFFFHPVYPFALFIFTNVFLSLSFLTQTDLLPGGFPVFRSSVQQSGDSGCERHHICCTTQREHSGAVPPCCLDDKHHRACLFCTLI